MPINFYNRGDSYGRENGKDYFEFTNFATGYPITVRPKQIATDGNLVGDPSQSMRTFPTSEHLFQAMKFWHRSSIVDNIQNTKKIKREEHQREIDKLVRRCR